MSSSGVLDMQCSNCQTQYTVRNPPRKLKNCQHIICERCLISSNVCSIDALKIELRKYGMKFFVVAEEIMAQLKKEANQKPQQISKAKQQQKLKAPETERTFKGSDTQINGISKVKGGKNREITPVVNYNKENDGDGENRIRDVDDQCKDALSKHQTTQEKVVHRKEDQNSKNLELLGLQLNQNSQMLKNLLQTPAQGIEGQHQGCNYISWSPNNLSNNTESPKTTAQTCLVHSKPCDVICLDDGQIICSSCCLFGEHRGHNIEQLQNFIVRLGELTENTLQLCQQMRQKQQTFNKRTLSHDIKSKFSIQRQSQAKQIKKFTQRVIQFAKKAQLRALKELDQCIVARKQSLLKEVPTQELELRLQDWYGEVEKLTAIMDKVYTGKGFQEGCRYLEEGSQESYVLNKGEYLRLEYGSSENVYQKIIEEGVKGVVVCYDQAVCEQVQKLYKFQSKLRSGENTPGQGEKLRNQASSVHQGQSGKQGEFQNDDDILLDNDAGDEEASLRQEEGQNSLIPNSTVLSLDSLDMEPGLNIKQRFVASVSSIHGCDTTRFLDFSTTTRPEVFTNLSSAYQQLPVTTSSNIYLDSTLTNRKTQQKLFQYSLGSKYRPILQSLKKDKVQTVNFSNAALDDGKLSLLCQQIAKCTKLRHLKLSRNKLTDQCIEILLRACGSSGVVSVDLTNNSLTQKAVEILENMGRELKGKRTLTSVSMKFNKIGKIVKGRVEQLKKMGIVLTL